MTFALPVPKRTKMKPRLVGGHEEPATGPGGVVQRFTDVGTGKWALDVTCPPMTFDEASALVGGLLRAQREEVTLPWPQPGLVIGNPGTAHRVDGAVSANATVLPVYMGAAYVVRALQFFNVVGPDGRLYLHAATQQNQVPGSLVIAPALRIPGISSTTVVDFANVRIQGFVQGKETAWDVDTARHFGVAFSVMERK